jgi:hypothetical protein
MTSTSFKISASVPMTLPSNPSNGEIAVIVHKVIENRSSSGTTRRPVSSMLSFINCRYRFALITPAARMRPNGNPSRFLSIWFCVSLP